jgi:hypothetical protein
MSLYILAGAALTLGAANSLLTRVVQGVSCDASCAPSPDAANLFTKPVFVTALAFAAMSSSLLLPLAAALLRGCRRPRTAAPRHALLYEGDEELHGSPVRLALVTAAPAPPGCASALRRYAMLLVPAILDVTATGLQTASVLFIPAGTSSAMRGSLLLFTGLSNWVVGGREGAASSGEWAGIFLAAVGASLAGLSSALNSGTVEGGTASLVVPDNLAPASVAVLGLGLSLASNALQGVQVAAETVLLQGAHFGAVEANGVEGLIGAALLVLVLGVAQATGGGADNGHVEDTVGTLCCLERTPALTPLVLALGLAFAGSTAAYMALSTARGGNFRALIMVARAGLVWIAELGLYYGSDGLERYGQPFRPYDWCQAAGFALLVAGGGMMWAAQSARERAEAAAAAEGEGATQLKLWLTPKPGRVWEEELLWTE